MKHVLLDTNIPLNMMLDAAKRAMPVESTLVMNALANGGFVAYITPTTFSNIYYAVRKERGQQEAIRSAGDLLDVVRIVEQNETVFRNALDSGWPDVEDAGQYFAAKRMPAITHLCTTNGRHYKRASDIKVVSPDQLLALLK